MRASVRGAGSAPALRLAEVYSQAAMVGTPEMEMSEVKATFEAKMVQRRIAPTCRVS